MKPAAVLPLVIHWCSSVMPKQYRNVLSRIRQKQQVFPPGPTQLLPAAVPAGMDPSEWRPALGLAGPGLQAPPSTPLQRVAHQGEGFQILCFGFAEDALIRALEGNATQGPLVHASRQAKATPSKISPSTLAF